jgi:4-amino-4-deoxy-L-arabinose transferase-like glycosyltransferase
VLKLTTDDGFERCVRLGWFTGDMDEFQHATGARIAALRALRNGAIREARIVVCPSTYLAELAEAWGANPRDIVVLPNAGPRTDRLPTKEDARRSLAIEGTVLVFAGRLGRQKALEVALEAIAPLSGVTLLVAGDGPDRPVLEAQAARLGLQSRVRFLGAQPHERVLELLRAADASLLSSDWENLPHSVVESLAVGTPVIATAVGGVPELVQHEVNGLLVPPREPPALTEAIRKFSSDGASRNRLTAKTSSSVAAYAPDRVYGRLAAILESTVIENADRDDRRAAPAHSPPLQNVSTSRANAVVASAGARTKAVWERIPLGEPWRVLVPLVIAQWVAVAIFASSVHHNGWLFYQGGDEIWYWTTGWLAGHGLITKTLVSPGWSFLLLPFAVVLGPGFIAGLPAAILIQALLLAPIALFCVYDITARIGGRVLGYLAAALWVFGPYISIPFFIHRYHPQYVDEFLPHALGLTAMADYASTVALLAASCCMVRAFQARSIEWSLAAGLLTGVAVLTKASNLIFLPAPLLLFLVARRWRELASFALATAPAIGALALWKYRGYGYLPAFSNAAPSAHLALATGSVFTPISKYGGINWTILHDNMLALGKFFFSVRLLEFLPFAGALAVARRAPALALSLSTWFWLYFLMKGSDPVASMNSGAFWRLLLPAIPPLLIMVASIPVLAPTVGPRLARRFPPSEPRALGRRTLVVATVLFALLPLGAAAALQPAQNAGSVLQVGQINVPVSATIDPRAAASSSVVTVKWNPVRGGSVRVFYKLLRHRGRIDTFCPSDQGGASRCSYWGRLDSITRATSTIDRPPRTGAWTYRVAVGANWVDNPRMGDVFLVSQPVVVMVPRAHA